jgi:bacterioferritin-associated ferredoxin
MIVCLCHRISDRDIHRAVQHGVHDFDALQDDTCVARNCACCEDCAREVFEDALAEKAAKVRGRPVIPLVAA